MKPLPSTLYRMNKLKYTRVVPAVFLRRPNRFIAQVVVEGREETVHVKNTGRCKELLVPGCKVYLACADKPERKTKYDLIAVEKVCKDGIRLINMDSQLPNDAAEAWLPQSGLFSPGAKLRREVVYGDSRFDFCIQDGERTAYLEVKGVTLEVDGVAYFPDAPTVRGVKHLRELTAAAQAGLDAYVLFVVQMKGVSKLKPNDSTHKEFGDALRQAAQAGVKVLAIDCIVSEDMLLPDRLIPVEL